MIQRKEAQSIAEAEAKRKGLGTGIRHVDLWDELTGRRPTLYNIDLSHCWIAYIERPITGLQSSTIVAVDRDFGVVMYAGSANDEG